MPLAKPRMYESIADIGYSNFSIERATGVITNKIPFSVHEVLVDSIICWSQVEMAAGIEPRLERERTRLFIEWKPRDVYGTGSREPAWQKPITSTVRLDTYLWCNCLVKQNVNVFVVAVK